MMLVEWTCTNKKKLMRTLIFDRMVVHNGRINERRSCIFIEWSCANERNKSMRTLILGQMVVHKTKNK